MPRPSVSTARRWLNGAAVANCPVGCGLLLLATWLVLRGAARCRQPPRFPAPSPRPSFPYCPWGCSVVYS